MWVHEARPVALLRLVPARPHRVDPDALRILAGGGDALSTAVAGRRYCAGPMPTSRAAGPSSAGWPGGPRASTHGSSRPDRDRIAGRPGQAGGSGDTRRGVGCPRWRISPPGTGRTPRSPRMIPAWTPGCACSAVCSTKARSVAMPLCRAFGLYGKVAGSLVARTALPGEPRGGGSRCAIAGNQSHGSVTRVGTRGSAALRVHRRNHADSGSRRHRPLVRPTDPIRSSRRPGPRGEADDPDGSQPLAGMSGRNILATRRLGGPAGRDP